MRTARALAAAAVLAVLATGCDGSGGEDAPAPGRGVGSAGAAPAGEGDEPGDPLVPPAEAERVRLSDYDPRADPPAAAEAREAAAADERSAPERDLPAELRERVGDPSSCLNDLDELPGEVTISVEATVVGTGVITRSYASGGGLPDQALGCVRRRLDGARLRAPIEGAPRTVRTTLVLRRREPDGE